MTCETAISIKEITHYFGEKKVLAGISFSVEKGEILGLLGGQLRAEALWNS